MQIDNLKDCTSRLELVEQLVNAAAPRSFLEVGVWKGELAAHVLARCSAVERYFMIDPWRPLPSWNKPFNVDAQTFERVRDQAMQAVAFAHRRTVVLRGTTREVIDRIPNDSIDMAYVDGDHSLRGISIDLIAVFPKVKAGGLLAGDDFVPSIWQHGAEYEPTLVFPFAVYFAEAVGATIHALPHNQFVIEKPVAGQGTFKFEDRTGRYGNLELRPQLAGGGSSRQGSPAGLANAVWRGIRRLLGPQ